MSEHEVFHPEHPQCPFVTKEICSNRTKTARWVAGVFFGVLGVFLALVIYAAGQASEAGSRCNELSAEIKQVRQLSHDEVMELRTTFATHKAAQGASEKAIIDKLDELKTELSEQRKEQRGLLDKILELQVELAKKNIGNP